MSYSRIRTGAYVIHLGQRCDFERRQGHTLEWRGRDTQEHFAFTDRQMQSLIASGRLTMPYSGYGRAPAEEARASRLHGGRSTSDEDLEEAGRKMVYVMAVRDAQILRPDAAPADWRRVIDAVHSENVHRWSRLRGKGRGKPAKKPCLRSVRNWVADAGDPPDIFRLVSRHRFKGNYDDRLQPRVRLLVDEMVDDVYLQRPGPTLQTFGDLVRAEVERLNEKLPEHRRLILPGLDAIRSSIASHDADEIVRRRRGDVAAFLKHGSGEAQKDPERPLERVELDSTPADLFVVCARTGLPLGRPTIVLCVDRCTRMVLGWVVTFEKPSVLTLMECLRNAMLPKDYIGDMNDRHGWNIRHECETWGVMEDLYVDRSAENVATHLPAFAYRAGINRVIVLGGKRPWLKGCVEQVICTMSERVLHPAAGTSFHNALMLMGYDPAKDAVCTTDDLDWALTRYFVDIYPREECRALNLRRRIDVWRDKVREHPVRSVGDLDEVAHLFGRTASAAPGRHGIAANGMQYYSRELADARRGKTFERALRDAGGRVEYHFSPADLGTITVRLPNEDRTIVVPAAPKWRDYATGLSLYAHRKIREFNRARSRKANEADQLLQSKLELFEMMRKSALSKKARLRDRQQWTRIEGVARVARSGQDASTTVPGSPAHDRRDLHVAPEPSNDMGQRRAENGPAPAAPSDAVPSQADHPARHTKKKGYST